MVQPKGIFRKVADSVLGRKKPNLKQTKKSRLVGKPLGDYKRRKGF